MMDAETFFFFSKVLRISGWMGWAYISTRQDMNPSAEKENCKNLGQAQA